MFNIKQFIRRHPALYFSICGFFSSRIRELRAYPDSELVIEGFPRSANTSSVYAFLHAQKRPVKLGHHLHTVAHVKYAVQNQVPCLVITRSPVDCITSLMVMRGGGNPRKLLSEYIDFTKEISKLRKDIVLVSFTSIVESDFGFAISLINERFGTQFAMPTGSNNEKSWVNQQIVTWNNMHGDGDRTRLSLPSKDKKGLAEVMRVKVIKETDLLQEADRLYKLIINGIK